LSKIIKSFNDIFFNKGYDEHLTLVEFIKLLASIIKPDFEKVLKFKEEKNCRFKHEFPSVTVAPVDTTKIKRILNFQFSNILDSIKDIVDFYNKAYKEFPSERRLIAKDVAKQICRSDEERDAFKDFIRTFNP
jgi:predicted helicase